jgi:hypothetical protein
VKVLGKRTAAVLCPGWRARLSISYIYEEAMDTLTKLELPVKLPAQQIQAITRALSDPRRFQILQQIASHTCSPGLFNSAAGQVCGQRILPRYLMSFLCVPREACSSIIF